MHFICAIFEANDNFKNKIWIFSKKSVKNNQITHFLIPDKKIKRKVFLLITQKILISEKNPLVIFSSRNSASFGISSRSIVL